MGSFTPLVFGTNGGMGADCNSFLKRLAEKLLEKNEESYTPYSQMADTREKTGA